MRRLCWFTLGFGLAVAIYLGLQPDTAALWMSAGFLILGLVGLLLGGRKLRRAVIAVLGISVGFVWCFGYQALFLRPLKTVAEEEEAVEMIAEEYARKSTYGYSVVVRIRREDRWYQGVLYFDEEFSPEPGDKLYTRAKLTLAEEKQKDDNFYYSSRGVWLIASARTPIRTEKTEHRRFRYAPVYANHALRESCEAIFPQDAAVLMEALLLGEKSGLSYEQKNDLSVAGIYHAVAVSGMHVSILLGMLLLLCGSRKKLAAAIGLPMIVFFVLMTGAPASAVRAGVMQCLLLLAPLLGRENDMPTSLCAALALLLLENPWSMLNVGLQLSFISTAGIMLFAGPIYRLFAGGKRITNCLRKKTFGSRLVQAMLVAASTSFAATAFSMPLAAWQFEVVSLIAPLTNMLCLWTVTILFSAGMVLCVLGLICAPLMLGPAWLLSWLCRYVLLIVRLFAGIPYAALYFEDFYSIALGVFVYLAVLIFAIRPQIIRHAAVPVSTAAALVICLSLAALDYRLPAFTFTALDVGQGQCLIFHADGKTTVIDCGGTAVESGEIAARYLQSRGEFRVENLVLTHFDADHVNGAEQLLRRERVQRLYIPDFPDSNGLYEAILCAAEARGTEACFVREDIQIPDSGAELTVFAPNPGKNSNETGLCVLASAEKYDILVTGDLPEQAEYRMMSTHTLPDLELLVAGHHGAKTSTSSALLEATLPETVLISVGADNRFGHPAQETTDRILASGAELYRTDQCGTVTIRKK